MLAVPDPYPTPNVLLEIMYGEEVDVETLGRDLEALRSSIMACAPSFDEFLYRLWLETTICFKLDGDDPTPLTVEERRYLAHYRRHPPTLPNQ